MLFGLISLFFTINNLYLRIFFTNPFLKILSNLKKIDLSDDKNLINIHKYLLLFINRIILMKILGVSIFFINNARIVYEAMDNEKTWLGLFIKSREIREIKSRRWELTVIPGKKNITPIQTIQNIEYITYNSWILIKCPYSEIKLAKYYLEAKIKILSFYEESNSIRIKKIVKLKTTALQLFGFEDCELTVYYDKDQNDTMLKTVICICKDVGLLTEKGYWDYFYTISDLNFLQNYVKNRRLPIVASIEDIRLKGSYLEAAVLAETTALIEEPTNVIHIFSGNIAFDATFINKKDRYLFFKKNHTSIVVIKNLSAKQIVSIKLKKPPFFN